MALKTRDQLREERKAKGFCQCDHCLDQDDIVQRLRQKLGLEGK